MTRASLSLGLVILLVALSSAVLHTVGCGYDHLTADCPTKWHEGHLDELGNPDPCCYSIVPCCPNPIWGRVVEEPNGFDVNDPCCMDVPCPGWDPWKGADAGADSSMSAEPEPDAGAEPDADTNADAGADAGP
jgi:hypothetical protein